MHKTVRTLVVCSFACAIACLAIVNRSDAQKTAPDLTGTWQINYVDDNGVSTSHPKLSLQQTGGKLTGTFGNQDWPIIGTLDRGHIVFTFTAYGHEGAKAISDTVFYWGNVDSDHKMSGRMKNPKESGDWQATRQ